MANPYQKLDSKPRARMPEDEELDFLLWINTPQGDTEAVLYLGSKIHRRIEELAKKTMRPIRYGKLVRIDIHTGEEMYIGAEGDDEPVLKTLLPKAVPVMPVSQSMAGKRNTISARPPVGVESMFSASELQAGEKYEANGPPTKQTVKRTKKPA